MGEQITPDNIGKEVGVRADLRRGNPKPREIKSPKSQFEMETGTLINKDIKLAMSKKIGSDD